MYFWPPHHHAIKDVAGSLPYVYGHFFIFAAGGAFSAGIEVEIDVLTAHTTLAQPYAPFAITAAALAGAVAVLVCRPPTGRSWTLRDGRE